MKTKTLLVLGVGLFYATSSLGATTQYAINDLSVSEGSWALFEGSMAAHAGDARLGGIKVEYDRVKSTGGSVSKVKEGLLKAYRDWQLYYNSLHARGGAAEKIIRDLGGKKRALADVSVGDANTLAKLAKHHKPALIGAMAAHDATAGTRATADEVVGNATVLGHLGEHHKAALIGAMAGHNPAATAAEIAGNADLKRELATTHHGDIVTALGAHNAAGAATAIVADVALRNEVIRELEGGNYAVGAAKVSTIVRGADPAANAPYGDGRWHDVFSNWGGGRGNNDGGKTAVRELIVALDVGITNAELAD